MLCDRFADSTRVYQGAARADLRGVVDALHDLMIGREPDLTLILDLDPAEAFPGASPAAGRRTGSSGSALASVRLRDGFLALAAEFPDRCRVIRADGPAETVAGRIAAAVG